MKLSIEHLGIKRLIEGSGFNICASREDLLTVADQIKKAVDTGFVFGRVQIRTPIPDPHFSGPNKEPLPWGAHVMEDSDPFVITEKELLDALED